MTVRQMLPEVHRPHCMERARLFTSQTQMNDPKGWSMCEEILNRKPSIWEYMQIKLFHLFQEFKRPGQAGHSWHSRSGYIQYGFIYAEGASETEQLSSHLFGDAGRWWHIILFIPYEDSPWLLFGFPMLLPGTCGAEREAMVRAPFQVLDMPLHLVPVFPPSRNESRTSGYQLGRDHRSGRHFHKSVSSVHGASI